MPSTNVACYEVQIQRHDGDPGTVDVLYRCRKIEDSAPVDIAVANITPDQVVPAAPITQDAIEYELVDALP